MTPSTRWSPLVIAIIVRAASLFYLLVVHPLTVSPQGAFDTSTSILLALSPTGTSDTSDKLAKALEPFVKWDNLYFAQIAVRGYQHEQELAFMPIWPLVMRWSGMAVQKLRLLLAVGSSTQYGSSQTGALLGINDVVLGGVIVTNIVSVLNVVAFQKLTYRITKNHRYTTLCAILYALHPAPAISSVPYTEPFYTLCTFLGSRLVLLTSGSNSSSSPNSSDLGHLDGPTFTSGVNLRSRLKRGRYGPTITRRRTKHLLLRTLGITCLMLSSGTRSLGVLNSVLIVWPLLVRLYEYRLRRGIFTTLRLALWAGIECILVGSPFAALQYYAYRAFCTPFTTSQMLGHLHGDGKRNPSSDLNSNLMLARRPWCEKRIPLAYNYVQEHYWDVGFLRYWTPAQLPNFVLVVPILVASIYGIYRYWQLVFRRFTRSKTTTTVSSSSQSRPASSRSRSRSKSDIDLDLDLDLQLRQTLWENPQTAPFFLIHTLTTLILVFASHTQIALRVSMGNPVLFWIVGAFVSSSSSNSSRKYRRGGGGGGGGGGRGRTARWARRGIVWSCTWGAVSLVLWAGFYPPA
ncbi:GPI mannosyltransferase 2 [Filobasidium floriforme]|uniref:GPI mannosyltransferase 2 n=1 Tax=Filobasidium floriforme TaxID=5210 RepID=UPI001E8EA833|nr:GPI mannosyltransferase 2 [Filobasidium floriforme]KAH8083507.1 GPI mannosyltransferase 2 [Filobasidium floriforme]